MQHTHSPLRMPETPYLLQEMYEMEAIPDDSDVVTGDLRGRGEGVTGARAFSATCGFPRFRGTLGLPSIVRNRDIVVSIFFSIIRI